MQSNDPFACFGSDDEEEGENEIEIETNHMNQIEAKLNKDIESNSTNDEKEVKQIIAKQINFASDSTPTLHELWKNEPFAKPKYKSKSVEVKLVQGETLGGGRGYFATEDLSAGTLILIEEPIFTWPKEQIGKPLNLKSIEYILSLPYSKNILNIMQELHPTKKAMQKLSVRHEDSYLLRTMKLVENEHLTHLKNLEKSCQLPKQELLRMLLTLRYNGFQSGVYPQCAMLNHSCVPNCIKFSPNTTSSTKNQTTEVWTTTFVKKNQELTIHYLVPREQAYFNRRQSLLDQHGFCIERQLFDEGKVLEQYALNFETKLLELEQLLEESNLHSLSMDELETIHEKCWELIQFTKEEKKLQTFHILFIRLYRLSINVIEVLLKQKAKDEKIVLSYYKISKELHSCQSIILGNDHVDLAVTCQDVSHAISLILSSNVKIDFENKSNSNWAREEYWFRSEYDRIKALYSNIKVKTLSY